MPSLGDLIDGRYLLENVVRSGAMGVVFRARDQVEGRVVALKCIADMHANEDRYRKRFQLEIETISAATHDHILDVYDAGELDDGGLYLVMPYMPDGDLADYVKVNGPLAPRVAAQLMVHAAEALEQLHRAEIIHRDVKPSNLLLRRGEEGLYVYLSDFGIVKKAEETLVTGTESRVLGTPPFAAPEQFTGDRVGPPADVYAAGRTLAYLINGSTKDRVHDLGSVDRELRRIIKKATRRRPWMRYRTAGKLATALRNYIRLSPVSARPSWQYRAASLAVVAAAPLGFIVMRNDILPKSSTTRFGVVDIPRSEVPHEVRSGFGVGAAASRPILALRSNDRKTETLTVGTRPVPAKAALGEIATSVGRLPVFGIEAIGPYEADVVAGRLDDGRQYVIDAVPALRGYVVLACLGGKRRSPHFFDRCRREVASVTIAKGSPRAARPSKSFISALPADWSLGVSARRRNSTALKADSLAERARAAFAVSDGYRRGASKLLTESATLVDESLARRVGNSMSATAEAFSDLAKASRQHDRHAYDQARTLIHRRDREADTLAASLKRSGVRVVFRAA